MLGFTADKTTGLRRAEVGAAEDGGRRIVDGGWCVGGRWGFEIGDFRLQIGSWWDGWELWDEMGRWGRWGGASADGGRRSARPSAANWARPNHRLGNEKSVSAQQECGCQFACQNRISMECQSRRNAFPARFFLGLFIFCPRNMGTAKRLTLEARDLHFG